MTRKSFDDKIANQIMIALIILIISMCIWKISGITGTDTVFMLIFISMINAIGMSILIRNLYQLAVTYVSNEILLSVIKCVILVFIIWIFILIYYLYKGFDASSARNIFGRILYFEKITIINYPYLTYSYIIICLLTVVVPVMMLLLIRKGLTEERRMQAAGLIGIAKEALISYGFTMVICMVITAAFLMTGEHKSTPLGNAVLNILYFGSLLVMIWRLVTYFNRIKQFAGDADVTARSLREVSFKRNVLIFLRFITFTAAGFGSVMIIRGYSYEMDFEYNDSTNHPGYVEIFNYTGERPDVTVPGIIDGKPVVSICFRDSPDYIRSIRIEDGIKIIDRNAFTWCSNLVSVSLPAGIEEIRNKAFSGCYNLEKINIPAEVTEIGWSAFSYCSKLTDISLPDGLVFIDEYAFLHCKSLERIEIPEGINTIARGTFYGCSKLETVILPESVKRIETEAYYDCRRLREIQVPQAIEYIDEHAFGTPVDAPRINIVTY